MSLRPGVLLVALLAATAQATDSPTLAKAIDDFQRGAFDGVRTQLERLKTSSALSAPDQIELRTYLAATYHALGDTQRAYEELFELFKTFRSARVDPELFVPAVVDLAERAKADAAGPSQAPPAIATATPDVPRDASPKLFPRSPGPSTPLLFVPFGVGQFARGEPDRALGFLIGEAALFVVAGVSLAVLESSKVRSDGFLRGGTFADPARARLLNATAFSAFWMGVSLSAWGVLDAAMHPRRGAPVEAGTERTP